MTITETPVAACGQPRKYGPCRMPRKVVRVFLSDLGIGDGSQRRRWVLNGCADRNHQTEAERGLLEMVDLYQSAEAGLSRQRVKGFEDAALIRLLEEKRAEPSLDEPVCWAWFRDTDLPPRDLVELQAWQAGRCAMCGAEGYLVVDHDHWSGWVRGFICANPCNAIVGSPGNLAQDGRSGGYRQRHPAGHFELKIPYSKAAVLLGGNR